MSLYQVLNVPKSASRKEIKDAYYSLSKKVHPDISQNKDSVNEFLEISKAYSILSNASSRRDYDLSLGKTTSTIYHHHQKLDPDDYKLYKNNTRGSYNYHEWDRQHYPFNSNKKRNEYSEFHQYQEKRKTPTVFAYTSLVMVAVFFVNSGWIELMFT